MNIHENMVAVISFLCSREKANDYEIGYYNSMDVAEQTGISNSAVIRALQLANEQGYLDQYREGVSMGVGISDINFTL